MSLDTKSADKLLNKAMYNVRPEFIDDTDERTDLNGFAVQFLEETVIATITYQASATSNTMAAKTFAAGLIIYLPNITTIDLTSGACIVYQSSK